MEDILDSIKTSLRTANWHSALAMSLTLPDMCGKIDSPELGSAKRSIKWFKSWLEPKYTIRVGPQHAKYLFLSGEDCYALRCAFLHQGQSSIEDQRARKALTDFEFVSPKPDSFQHCNQFGTVLQLQVDIFCTDMVNAVYSWLQSISDDKDKLKELSSSLVIK